MRPLASAVFEHRILGLGLLPFACGSLIAGFADGAHIRGVFIGFAFATVFVGAFMWVLVGRRFTRRITAEPSVAPAGGLREPGERTLRRVVLAAAGVGIVQLVSGYLCAHPLDVGPGAWAVFGGICAGQAVNSLAIAHGLERRQAQRGAVLLLTPVRFFRPATDGGPYYVQERGVSPEAG